MKPIFLTGLLLIGCITGGLTTPIEEGSISVLFCDKVNCSAKLGSLLDDSEKVCAMYHGTSFINEKIGTKNLIVDESHPFNSAAMESGNGLMHNKFCVINESLVWTGSWNPSQEMSIPNNVVLIESRVLGKAFSDEFNEMKKGVFHGGKEGSAKTLLNGSLIEAYFCPEDNCEEKVINELKKAKFSIDVMVYSFTDDDIGNLILKKSKEGLNTRVIFDPRKDKYSEYERLKKFSKIAKVHHKVFIIDKKIVVTGSYNPTKSGDERNDENIVIIHNEFVARQFLEEFDRLWSMN